MFMKKKRYVYLIFDYDCTYPNHASLLPLVVTKDYFRALSLASKLSESFPKHYIRKVPLV